MGPPAPWRGLGGPGGVWGGLPSQKFPLALGDQFQPWDALFWIETTCNTMFLRFGVRMGPSGPKKAVLGPNRVCKKVDISQNTILDFPQIGKIDTFWVNNNDETTTGTEPILKFFSKTIWSKTSPKWPQRDLKGPEGPDLVPTATNWSDWAGITLWPGIWPLLDSRESREGQYLHKTSLIGSFLDFSLNW